MGRRAIDLSFCNLNSEICNLTCSPRSGLLPHGLDGPLLVGKLPGLQLGVKKSAIDCQLEASAPGRDKLQILDLLLVDAQQLRRQTDGLRFVVSHRAVFEFHTHE